MLESLELLGINRNIGRWVIGDSRNDKEGPIDRHRRAWGNLKLYGKGGRAVQAHVNELYSPPRVNCMVERLGLVPRASLDLTTNDPADNMPWDFNKQDKRDNAEALVKAKSSLLLVVSPMCVAFSHSRGQVIQRWIRIK